MNKAHVFSTETLDKRYTDYTFAIHQHLKTF